MHIMNRTLMIIRLKISLIFKLLLTI